MKNTTSLIIGSAVFAVLAIGPAGLIVLAALFNFGPAPYALGTSYPVPASQTTSGLVALTAKAQEELWTRQVVLGSDPTVDETPFADGMIGRVREGKPSNPAKLRKAIIEILDTAKVYGQTVNIPTRTALGGEGAAGEATRLGTEAPQIVGNLPITIGRQYYGTAIKGAATDQTIIGANGPTNFMKNVGVDLRALHNRKKSNSCMMRMIQAAGSSGPNLLYPVGIAGRDNLIATSFVDTTLIARGGDYLPGIGALPMDTTQDSGGSVGRLYMFLSTQVGLRNLASEPAYVSSLQLAAERGETNPVFQGGFTKWNGHGIYRWVNSDHANNYSIGSPLLPRAKLGLALTNADTGSIIHGGNTNGYNSETSAFKPAWFENFSNAPYSFYGGINNIGAVTNVVRYLAIINSDDPTKYGYYTYEVNDGNAITILAKYTRAVTGMNEGEQVRTHPAGSLIVEVNAKGQPFGKSLMFGAQAVAAGIGRIDGSPTAPEMGRLIDEWYDQKNDHVIGVDAVYGCAAVQRAGDNSYPNFVVIEHSIFVDSLPVITT